MPDFAASTIAWGASTITLLELMKQLLDIVDASQDDELSMYLQIAGEAAESYVDNKLALQEVKEQFPSQRSPIALRYYQVSSLDAVDLDGQDLTADWSLYFSEGIAWAEDGSKCGTSFEQLIVTYQAGWEPLPAEIGYAIVQIAIAYQQSAGSAPGAVKKESIVGVGSVEYVTAADANGNTDLLSPSTRGVLEKYRRFNA